jgi:hypothetical protein
MSNVFANRALVATATTGTGTVTLGSALAGYQTFGDAGVQDGDLVRYLIIDDTDWEVGIGTYTSSGTTLSRTASESSATTTALELDLSGNARVMVIASAEDYETFIKGPASVTTGNVAVFDGTTGKLLDELVAAADHQVLRRSGSAIGFGAVALNQAAAVTGALPVDNGGTGGTTQATARTGLGLGTAATATLTTSSADSTAGRVLKVADFGIGGTGGSPALADIDSFTIAAGTYQVNNTTVTGTVPPGATVADAVIVVRPTGNQTTQIYSIPNDGRTFIRKSNAATSWGPWRELLIGTATPPAPPNTDFNDASTFGVTQTVATAANRPAGDGHAVLTLPRTAANFAQLSMRTDNAALRYATLLQGRQISSTGGVGEWVNFYHNRNIVGTVSQTGGIPTGAIIGRGQTANGEWARFADGTQICTGYISGTVDITTASNTGLGFVSDAPAEWTFPQPFAVDSDEFSPVVKASSYFANPRSLVCGTDWNVPGGGVTTIGLINLWRGASETGSAYGLWVQAIGRWF